MMENSASAIPPSPLENPLTAGSDVFSALTAALDVARNQFRARQFQEASTGLAKLIARAEGQLLATTSRLTPEDTKRVNVVLACALTLDGRCEEESGRDQHAQELWTRAVSIFDDNLPRSTQSEDGWLSRFSKWVSLLSSAEGPKDNVPGDLLAYYGTALRMVGRRAEAISVLRQVTQMGSAAPETYRHLGLALKDEGDFSKAVEELKQALERSPSDLRGWRGLAEAQEKLGNKTEAARVYLGLAQVLVAAGQPEEALLATGESLRLNDSDPAALCYRSDLLRLSNRLDDALQTLERALALSPDNPVAWTIKGATLYGLRRNAEALNAFDRALKQNPTDAWTLAMKGEVLMTVQRYDEAEQVLRESIRLNPASAPALSVLGLVLGALKRPEEALQQANKALALDPTSVFALGVRGGSLMRLRQFEDALSSYERATRLNNNSTFAWAGQADALVALGRVEEAIQALDRLIAIDPNDAGGLANKGEILWRTSDPARRLEGINLLRKALALHPSAVDTAHIASIFSLAGLAQEALQASDLALQSEDPPASAFFIKAEALQSLSRPEEALAAAEEGLRRTPELEWAYGLGLKGQALQALGRIADAEDALRHSIRLDPKLERTWRALSDLLNQSKRPEEGLLAADQSLELNQNNPNTLGLKAQALAALRREPEAIACLQQAAQLDPSLDWVHERLGELFEKQGRHDEALRELDECIARNEKSATAFASRGFILHSMGERKRAQADLEVAIGLDPSLGWAYAELASVRRELEDPEGALDAIDKSLALAPGYAAALEIKGQLFIAIGENEAALRVLNLSPEANVSLYFWKGLALDNLNRLAAARECFENALKLEPEDVWSLRALADIRLLQGEVDAARQIFEQILTRASSGPRGPYELGLCGWCHYGCGRLEPAIRNYSEALSLDRQGVLKSGQFDLALILACARRYPLATREYERAIDLAHQAHPWIQKNLFGVAIADLKRAMEIRYREIASGSEVPACLARLQEEYGKASTHPRRPRLD